MDTIKENQHIIKSNEIRIGNWLNYELGKFQVRGTGKDCVWLNDMGGPVLLNGFMNIQPIPLTEEILLKCGFDVEYFGTIKTDAYKNKILTVHEIGGTINEYQVAIYNKMFPIYIKYLHQLQNLYFALTGEELTVNL